MQVRRTVHSRDVRGLLLLVLEEEEVPYGLRRLRLVGRVDRFSWTIMLVLCVGVSYRSFIYCWDCKKAVRCSGRRTT